jgi:hypothetical protein
MSVRRALRFVATNDGDDATPGELAWWREASRVERRRTLLFWAPWIGGLVLLPSMLRDPARFFAGAWMYKVPLALVAGLVGSWVNWRLTSPRLFQVRLAAKRVRDALLENR